MTNHAADDELRNVLLKAGPLLSALEHTLAELADFTAQLRAEAADYPKGNVDA